MGFEKFWRGYDWVARADLAVGWLFDWRKWLWSFVPGGAGMTFLWAAIEGRSPLDVWIAAVIVMAALAVLVYFLIAILEKIKAPRKAIATAESGAAPGEFADDIPDVRVAYDMVAWGLFGTPHHDKLLPLLEREKIEAWGRLGNGGPPLTLIPAGQWTTHYLDFRPALGNGSINQTFFRPKSRPYESTYYDVHLNRSQLERGWPGLWAKPFRITLQDFLHEEAVKSGWGPRPGCAADLGDLIKKIRQAAVDGTLHLWGKQTHMAWHAQALEDAPLISIDKDYWRDHEIDYLRAIFYDKGNSGTRSQHEFSEIDNPREPYYDLHLAREEALNWLRSPDGRP